MTFFYFESLGRRVPRWAPKFTCSYKKKKFVHWIMQKILNILINNNDYFFNLPISEIIQIQRPNHAPA